jgi:hypothetical protein
MFSALSLNIVNRVAHLFLRLTLRTFEISTKKPATFLDLHTIKPYTGVLVALSQVTAARFNQARAVALQIQ